MIGLTILYIIVAIIIVILFLSIYKPSIFSVKKIDPITSSDIGSQEKLNQVIATTNSLVDQVKSISDIVNNNTATIASIQSLNSNRVSTEDIENIKSQIQAVNSQISAQDIENIKKRLQEINSTYVDKTKPVGILAGTCSGGVCNTQGNYYRALTYNDKDTKFTVNGLTIPGIGHSKFVDTNKDRANFTQWFISQEYPKQVVAPVVPQVDPAPYVPPTGTSTTPL